VARTNSTPAILVFWEYGCGGKDENFMIKSVPFNKASYLFDTELYRNLYILLANMKNLQLWEEFGSFKENEKVII
jgi:hypothetical protein